MRLGFGLGQLGRICRADDGCDYSVLAALVAVELEQFKFSGGQHGEYAAIQSQSDDS